MSPAENTSPNQPQPTGGIKHKLPILVTSIIGAALLATGIFIQTPTGEQPKLAYNGDLWCVSNFVEERDANGKPVPISAVDTRPRKDPRLKGKEDWIVREQVSADDKKQAEDKAIANSHGSFQMSNADELRAALDRNDKEFFTHRFNSGATSPGPCMGTGDVSIQSGKWLSDIIREECFGISPTGFGSCKTKPMTIETKNVGNINLPSKGKVVQESHIVTAEENFQPTSITDKIQEHYKITSEAIGKNYVHNDKWTPAEGGGRIGRGSSISPPASVEPWIFNMYWTGSSIPAPGTRFIIRNPANGKTVVAAGGYETGPSTGYLLGAQEEVLQALGFTGGEVEVALAEDQSLPFGPIECLKNDASEVPKIDNAPDWCPDTPPESGPLDGKDVRLEIAKAFEKELLQRSTGEGEALNNGESKYLHSTRGLYGYYNGYNSVPLLKQGDSSWGANSYGCNGTTIKSAGCGITSAAMVLNFYGKNVDPAILAKDSMANGYRVCGGGTAAGFFSHIAAKYSLKYSAVSWSGIASSLKSGRPVIAAMDDTIFSSGGHYIVLTGISSDGKIMINDPGPRDVTVATAGQVQAALKHAHLIFP